MDVSKMCIDSSDANETALPSTISNSQRNTLPSLSQLPVYGTTISAPRKHNTSLQSFVNNGKSIYRNLSPRELRTKYQHQYKMQHQYLKSYTPIQDSYYENQTDYKHHYYPYQTDSSFTDTTQSSSSASTPLPSLTNMRSLVSQSPPQQPSPQQPSPQQPLPQQPLLQQPLLQQPSPQQQPPPQQPPPPLLQPRPSPPTMPTITEHNPLKTVIDQCTSIYEQIGKYRADPLRESERNRIIDHVYKTAEMMLQSLKEMEGTRVENPDSIMIDYASDDISSTTSAIKLNEDQYQPMNEEYKMIRQARNLQENSRPKYRRRSKRSMVGQRCHSCNTSETPEWRRGPDGARTLCNACGLHYSKLLRKGSLTVQTHNYMIEETTRVPRAIQFPKVDDHSPTSVIQAETISRISEIYNDDEVTK